jgi:hypothetical protein
MEPDKRQWTPAEPKKPLNLVMVGCIALLCIPLALAMLGVLTGVIFPKKPPLPKPPPVDVADLSPTQIVEAWLGKIQASDQVKASNAWCLDTPEVTFTGLEEWSIQNEVINEDRALVAVRVKSKSKLGVTQTKSGTVTLQRTGYRKGERSWCIVGFREL